jgi:hypothetical protein
MRLTSCVIFLLAAASFVAGQGTRIDQEHTKWIASVMDSIHTIKPGMMRQDLMKLFTTEGGISTRSHRTYNYRQCAYIKVTIEFQPVDKPRDATEMPTDRIVSISNPFLQYAIAD